MRLTKRLTITLALIAAAVAGQQTLLAHLARVRELPPTPLRKPLAELPRQLGDWIGTDLPISEKGRYADEHLRRVYRLAERQQSVTVWAAYSQRGQDRIHHPEVCLAVAGQQEDRRVRQFLAVPGAGDPIQQYKFRGLRGPQWVFYWHYTLPANPDLNLDIWQELYQRLQDRPASVTLEVFAPSKDEDDAEAAREFVAWLDLALRAHVGAKALRGSNRLPVTVIEGPPPETVDP